MAGFRNDVLFCNNVDFSGGSPVVGKVTQNGELLIGSSVAPFIRVATLTSSGATVAISNGAGTINLEAAGMVPTTFTADSGSATPAANNLNVLGQQASTVAVMATNGSGSTLKVEDRSWMTQYIVDPSATTGLKGTFTTIQSAINQAVTDGGPTITRTIFIRKGSYTENLVMPAANIHLCGFTPTGFVTALSSSIYDVRIIGNVTFTAGAAATFTNITFTTAGATAPIQIGNAPTFCNFNSCEFNNGGATENVTITAAGGTAIRFNHCGFQGGGINSSVGTVELIDCFVEGNGATSLALDISNGSQVNNFFGCEINGDTDISGTSGVNIYNGFINNPGSTTAIVVAAGSTASVYNTVIDATDPVVSGAGTYDHGGNTYIGVGQSLTATTQTVRPSYSLVPRTAVASSPYVVLSTDYFISVSTAAARTIQLPNAASTNQVFIVKDRTGSGAANNITVTTVGGAVNIDGATSFVINTNYGSAQFIFNGSTYEVF